MKNHEVAIMEVAGEFFDKGYRVYLSPQIYRYPNDPKLFKKKYIPDLLAIKNEDYFLIEIGYCPQNKLLELKRLVPSAKVLHITQWKNFVLINSKEHINGFSVGLPVLNRKNSGYLHWTEEETTLILELVRKGKSYDEVADAFPNYPRLRVMGFIQRLYKKGLVNSKPKRMFPVWSQEDIQQLIIYWNQGLTYGTISKHFLGRSYLSVIAQIQKLHNEKRLCFRSFKKPHPWISTNDILLSTLWKQGKTPKEIQKTEAFSLWSVNTVGNHIKKLIQKGLAAPRERKRKVHHIYNWTEEEDQLLISLRKKNLTSRKIVKFLPAHSQHNIKNRIATLKKQHLIFAFAYGKSP